MKNPNTPGHAREGEMDERFIHVWCQLDRGFWPFIARRPTGYLYLSKDKPSDYRNPPANSSLILHRDESVTFFQDTYLPEIDKWVKKVLHCDKCKLILYEYTQEL